MQQFGKKIVVDSRCCAIISAAVAVAGAVAGIISVAVAVAGAVATTTSQQNLLHSSHPQYNPETKSVPPQKLYQK